jgi:hypothetical protein
MKWTLAILPAVALAVTAATPASAATRHMHHHVIHHRAMMNANAAYGYGPNGPPQRPVYSVVNGKMIGRSDDPNIAYQMQNDDAQMYR